jgi:integrase
VLEVKDLDTPKRKARPVPDMILKDVLTSVPQHVVEAIMLTLYFGFRKGEAFRLQLRHIDFELGGVRLFAEEVKDDEDEFLPGAPEAMLFLRKLVDQAKERGTPNLISWKRPRKTERATDEAPWLPIKSSKSAWRTAMKRIPMRSSLPLLSRPSLCSR